MTRTIALTLGLALAALCIGCGKYGAPVRYRPVPAAEAAVPESAAVSPSGGAPAPSDEEAAPTPTPPPPPAGPRDPALEAPPGWQP